MTDRSSVPPPFHELVEHALVGVYVVQNERVVYANPEMGRLFGYAVPELLALPSIFDVVAESDRATVREMLRRRLEGEVETVHYVMRGRRSDGSTVDVEVLSRRTTYAGHPAVSGTMLDVTEPRQRERDLENRERRLRALLDNALDAVFTCDLEGRFTSMNRSGEELFGFPTGTAAGRGLFDIFAPEWHEPGRNFLAGAREAPRGLKTEVPVVTQQGAYLMVALSLQVIAREDAEPEVFGIARDVTARKRQEAALRSLTLVDHLTGLYNRRGFMMLAERHLKLAARKRRPVFLLFCDVDGLKRINDTLGHRAGDRALADAADILRRTYRSVDIIARLGGDEFTVFPIEAADESGSLLIARLEESVRAHNEAHSAERGYTLAISVGLSRLEPERTSSVEELLEEADRGLYRTKRARQEGAASGGEQS